MRMLRQDGHAEAHTARWRPLHGGPRSSAADADAWRRRSWRLRGLMLVPVSNVLLAVLAALTVLSPGGGRCDTGRCDVGGCGAGDGDRPTCQPQGILQMDTPYPVPQVQPGGLLICPNFPCTCCNRTHAAMLMRALHGAEEAPPEAFSARCADVTAVVACRVCDPEVGIGAKPHICASLCDSWLSACASDFFGFEPVSGALVPCTPRVASRLLVCSRLSELAPRGGRQLCAEVAGLPVADGDGGRGGGSGGSSCYSGAVAEPGVRTVCAGAPTAPRPKFTKDAYEAAAKGGKVGKPASKRQPREGVTLESLGLLALSVGVLAAGITGGLALRSWRETRAAASAAADYAAPVAGAAVPAAAAGHAAALRQRTRPST